MSGRRSPNPSSRSSGKQSAQQAKQKKVPAELVTYSLNGEMVYVEPARDYEQALDFAQNVFPQLVEISRTRIGFLVNVRVNGALRKVRIAPMAWPRVLQSLATYEIIELSILPELRASHSETELATSSRNSGATIATEEAPPKYGSANMLGADLCNPFSDNSMPHDSEKSPYFTLETPGAQQLPPSPTVKRCTSAFSWFSRRN
ncbi:hypothetical protein ACEPAF_2509 [Sanghuangporus sanghuang]